MARPSDPVHVVVVPLRANPREAAILDQRLRVTGQLRNAGLNDLLDRAAAMRRDPDYAAARTLSPGREKTRAFSDLRYRYGLQRKLTATIVFEHWRASKWMGEVVDSRTALALGAELLQSVDEWLFGHARRPRFKKATERNVVWGTDPARGLCFRSGRVSWRNQKTPRKNLELALDLNSISQSRRDDLASRTIVRVGIRRELVRGRTRYFALLCVKGVPYRSQAVLDRMAARPKGVVGIDFGPSLAAAVGPARSEHHSLAPAAMLKHQKEGATVLRRKQRALDRSRRAANPDCYDEQGRCIKRPRAMSKRGLQLQRRLSAEQRRSRLNRLQERAARAKQIVALGADVAFETIDKRNWQRSYGKRMGFTAPGALRDAIVRECERHGGRAIELPTQRLALSQHCLCGARVKKSLSQRAHLCAACGLGPLDRDLFSAYLARLCAESGLIDLADAPFNDHEHRQEAAILCVSPCSARANVGNQSGLRAKHEGQTPEQEPASSSGGKRSGRRPSRNKRRPRVAATVPVA